MNVGISELENKIDELNKQLSSPETLANSKKISALSIELAEKSEVLNAINSLEETKINLKETKELLAEETDSDLREYAEKEIVMLKAQLQEREAALAELLVVKDPDDGKNVILEIRAGAGGDEASLFAADLFRMYSKYAESKGWTVELLNSNQTPTGGFKEVVATISGSGAYGDLRFESGVHRVQRVPTTESAGRIHTSTITVAILPEQTDVDIEIRQEDLRIDVYRAGGPGGQCVNTTDSAVRITHVPTGLVVSCQDQKSQHKNRAAAMNVLKSRLYEAEQDRLATERGDQRRSQVGTGGRSEKIRTYNYPQDRVTDHRIKTSWHNLPKILEGDLSDIVAKVRSEITKDE